MRAHPLFLLVALTCCSQRLANTPSADGASDAANAGGSATSPESQDELPPILCPSCTALAGGSTSDFSEPPECLRSRSELTRDAATLRGYDIDEFVKTVEGQFAAPVQWDELDVTTMLHADVTVTGFSLLEPLPDSGQGCTEELLVGLQISVRADDSSVVGTFAGETAIANVGDLADPLWVSMHAWPGELRGTVELRTGTLGTPQSLQVWFNMLLQTSMPPRLGLEILGLYARDLESGDVGYTTRLQNAEPTDGCPAFMRTQTGTCVEVPPP